MSKLQDSINSIEVNVGEGEYTTRVLNRIAGGSFGEIYIGEIKLQKIKVAVKFELQRTLILPSLMNEGRFYRKLDKNIERIPIVYWFGYYAGGEYAVMIMELLGPSLYDLWIKSDQEFSLKSMLYVILETLSCLRVLHLKCCVHRDISPNNFAVGLGLKSNLFHIFDFGNALQLTNSSVINRSKGIKFYSFDKSIIGTPRFISIFTHLQHPPSYRDDMEAVGFMWIYLFKGRLPWQGIRNKINDSRLELIGKRKLEISIEDICDGMPEEFSIYLKYVRSLGYMEMPNHSWAHHLFMNLACKKNVVFDGKYDWEYIHK